jgi:hypothetical protein
MNTPTRKISTLAIKSAIDADYSIRVSGGDRFPGARTDFRAQLKINPDGTLTY